MNLLSNITKDRVSLPSLIRKNKLWLTSIENEK